MSSTHKTRTSFVRQALRGARQSLDNAARSIDQLGRLTGADEFPAVLDELEAIDKRLGQLMEGLK